MFLIVISVWRPIQFQIRSSINVRYLNLWLWAKRFKLPLYRKSFYFNLPIINIELLDKVFSILNRLFPYNQILLSDQEGEIISQKSLVKILQISREKTIFILDGNLGGLDYRFGDIWKPWKLSLGSFSLSNGAPLILTIIDFIDRNWYQTTNGTFIDNLGRKMWARPRNYKGYLVPKIIYSGDHKKILNFIKKD